MSTTKQKRVAKLIIENSKLDKPLNGGQMLEKVGYAKSMTTAKVSDVLESEGVKEELNKLGFSEEGAKKVVESILYDEEVDANARLKAADQVFKVHGSYAPDKSINVNVNVKSVDVTDTKVLEALKTINKQRANEQ